MKAEDFAEYYASLPDGELAKIASSRRTLVAEARPCLDAEIAKRGWTPEDIKQFKNYRHNYHDPESPVHANMRRSHLFDKMEEARKMPTLRWRGILVSLAVGLAGAAAFGHFGVLHLFMPTLETVMVLFFTLRFHWELKSRPWFWVVVGVWAGLHVWMLAWLRWPRGWVPARAWEGWLMLDIIAIFVIIALIEKLLHEGRFAPRTRRAGDKSASTQEAG